MPPVLPGIRHRRRNPSTASAIRLRAQRREDLPNIAASFRSESGLPMSMLAR